MDAPLTAPHTSRMRASPPPKEDAIFSLCLYRILDYNMPIITQTHLNRYEFEVDMDDDTKMYFDIPFDDEDYFFTVEILFNETFAFESKDISRVDVDAFGNLIFTDMKQRNYKKYLPEE